MSLNRYAAKRDANEPEIVAALRDAGYIVCLLKEPLDLLVGRRGNPNWALLEVKMPEGALRASQLKFIQETEVCTRFVVRTPQEAIRVCNVWIDRCADVEQA